MVEIGDLMKIMNSDLGYGVFSERAYLEGDLIKRMQGKILKNPTRHSIEISKDKHILDEQGMYMNHSFNPNCIIVGLDIIALEPIRGGDELTFNYNQTETKISYPFKDLKTGLMVEGNNNS
tara:strand:- start:6759 stop:7121 length:363 start_codon:yes stop_codon:yes gene_type:complete